ncbi:ATP-binding protein [Paraglaciecola sp.]|nr:ATP-binding protein [Paraglaciecola sp.]MDA9368401.1 ATP-binding protein [Flavobacteriaceae bacterium]MDB4282006.1 ATP-binding protein [Paraglaciecola sp.]
MADLKNIRLTLSRSVNELLRIVEETHAFFEVHGLSEDILFSVDMVIEEIFVNMVSYNQSSANIQIELTALDDGVALSFLDFDVDRFDPLAVSAPDLSGGLDDRDPGGLGMHLVLNTAQDVSYDYANRVSTLSMKIIA